MPRDKSETVGSYTHWKHFIRFGIEYTKDKKFMRWTCSCGSHGRWDSPHIFTRVQLFDMYKQNHFNRKHKGEYSL